jgi:AhpD family alkylhydroperoxidase
MFSQNNSLFPPATSQMSKKRADLAPDQVKAFRNFSKEVFKEGALDEKTKQIIAVAVAHVTQCPYCIKGHTKQAKLKGASNEELMEAIWVASEMRAGGAYAHAALALDVMEDMDEPEEV